MLLSLYYSMDVVCRVRQFNWPPLLSDDEDNDELSDLAITDR